MRLKKKWWWIISIVVVLVGGGVLAAVFGNKQAVSYVTEKVVKQDLLQTVEVTGSVESADQIDLNFNTAGTISQILVKTGDQVKQGQTLAYLSAGSLSAQVANARAAVDLAQSDLDKLIAGASSEDIQVLQERVTDAEADYQAALDALANTEATRDQEMSDLRTDGLNTLNDKSFVIDYNLDLVYNMILDADADSYLYVTNYNVLVQARNDYNAASNAISNLSSLITQAQSSGTQVDILAALDELEDVLQETATVLTDTFNVMLVTIENDTFTESIIEANKTTLNTQSAAVNTAIGVVHSAAADLRTRDLYYQTEITNKNNAIVSAANAVNLAKANLNVTLADPREFDIKAAQARVDQAKANLNRYLSDLSETVIKAPVDGLITKIDFDKGEQTSLAKPVITMIGLSTLQIEVDVPESDITKIAVSDTVDITLDALTSEDIFKGTVTFIDPAATVINEVIYYKVKVLFNEQNEAVKAGMTADLTIMTDKREQVLTIPVRAVVSKDDKKIVQVLENNLPVDKEVTVGLRGDSGLVEVLSGLDEGQDVITFIKNGK